MADTATNPLVITEAKTLARAADAIVALEPARRGNKNTVLNTIATAICGSGRNWGFLKGSPSPVRDPRVAAPVPTARGADRPVVFADLGETDKFPVALPDGKIGHLPRARLTPRADGGIDVTAHIWGAGYAAAPDDRLITHLLTFDAATCARIAADWPSPASLARDTAWAEGQSGLHLTISSHSDEIGLYFAPGVAVILCTDLFEMVQAQVSGAPSAAEPAPGYTARQASGGYRYDVRLTFVSDEFIGTDLSLAAIDYEITEGSSVGGPLDVTATPIDKEARNALAHQFGSDETFFLDEDEELPFRLEGDRMVFPFYHSVARQTYDIPVARKYAQRIRDALYGREARGSIEIDDVLFELVEHDQVVATTILFDGTSWELNLEGPDFRAALAQAIDDTRDDTSAR